MVLSTWPGCLKPDFGPVCGSIFLDRRTVRERSVRSDYAAANDVLNKLAIWLDRSLARSGRLHDLGALVGRGDGF